VAGAVGGELVSRWAAGAFGGELVSRWAFDESSAIVWC
jgi:hypothetical protein